VALLGLGQLWRLPVMAARGEEPQAILLDAVYFDGFAYGDKDEAVALRNVGAQAVDLGGWGLSNGSTTVALIPEGTWAAAGQILWLTGDGAAFAQQFGFAADVLMPRWPGFANHGAEVLLVAGDGRVVDVLVYGDGDTAVQGWSGPALQPYTVRGVFGAEGQIMARKRDQQTGRPLPDSDRAVDWVQDQTDPLHGRRVQYPGWDMERFFYTTAVTETAVLTVAVAPDNAFESLVAIIEDAQTDIRIESLTFENLAVAEALIKALRRGVAVRVLLEGSPVGGVPDQEKLVCQRLEAAGGACWFMIQDQAARIADRYRYLHAKFVLVDDRVAAISSENLSYNSMPDDDKADGTWGRRGVVLVTDAPGVVQSLGRIFEADWDPAHHQDLLRWEETHPVYGLPPVEFVPITSSGGITYPVRYAAPGVFQGRFSFELQQAPENILRDEDGLLGLVSRAGRGDTILVQQLQERPYWGASNSNPAQDPNLRLAQFVAAAQRGATVQLLLDDFFDEANSAVSNAATCALVNEIAHREQLRLSCTRGNPSGLGIHNKMVLLEVDGRGYVHAGSWNGSEQASKGNREVALLVQSDEAYHYLAEMFERDLPHVVYLPLFANEFYGSAAHVLIGEFVYDPYGADETEFIELVNPTGEDVDLTGYGLGDALNREDYEDLRRFPAGSVLGGGQVLVVTTSAVDFHGEYGRWPDFEILETTTTVANLIDDTSWGHTEAFLQLGNQGDEVILRDRTDRIVDALAYGSGAIPGQRSCPLLSGANHSYERYPYWQDSDDCVLDMRDWPFPSPGTRP
jgi:phosphatidylserine/phosphatidylglycerophosphate/cardiolipin synthase-like enzyme